MCMNITNKLSYSGNKITHNIVMYIFTPLKLTSNEVNLNVWEEVYPASPNSCRPLALMLGKETEDDLKEMYKQLASKRIALHSSPIQISHNGKLYNVHIILKMTMIDGKMRETLSGIGGGFCKLCTCNRDEAICINHSFIINRSEAQTSNVWNQLTTGELRKKPCDSNVRFGVTREPLVDLDMLLLVSPLHATLRTGDTILKIIYHLNAGLFNWSDEKSKLGDDGYLLLKESKVRVRASIKEGTSISVDMPDSTGKGGTSTTGNVVHELMSKEKNIQVLTSQVPARYQESLHELINRLYAITKVYNSTYVVDVEQYKGFCTETKTLLLTAFNENGIPWVFLTPTVHALLEHTGELIEANSCRGLGAYTESGLECSNKFLRLTRIALSRKTSQIDNLTDCINRLWVKSDLNVRRAVPEKKTYKKTEQERIRTSGFKGSLPLASLADYYIRDLVISIE